MNVEDLIGSLRRHWRIPAAIFFLAILIAGLFSVTRDTGTTKKTYEASSRFRIPTVTQGTTSKAAPADVPEILTNNVLSLALADATIAQAKSKSTIPDPDSVTYRATLAPDGDVVTLMTIAHTAKKADKSLVAYNNAFTDARENALVVDAKKQQTTINNRLRTLSRRKRELESQLKRALDTLPPLVLVNQNGEKTGASGGTSESGTPPQLELPDDASQQTRLMASERNSLYSENVRLEAKYGALSVQLTSPQAYASLIAFNKAGRSEPPKSSPLVPIGIILLVGLVAGLALALLADYFDHTIHTAKQASNNLDAPVLAKIPARHAFEERFADPAKGTERAAAYRGLAATAIATDRMPKALLVTSPTGETQDGVAYNFANSLTALGMRVALLATQPSQAWFLDPQEHAAASPTTLPDLLRMAHGGSLGDELSGRVAVSATAPNLLVVPPADEEMYLPLDGLAPLLAAFEADGIDLVVIAGPKMLDDADATIFAYSVRNVLWSIETHAVREKDARAAADHLELTGGASFGVALIGEEI